ncbi:unnamed protein product [Prunus brigantina]
MTKGTEGTSYSDSTPACRRTSSKAKLAEPKSPDTQTSPGVCNYSRGSETNDRAALAPFTLR